MTTGTAFRTPEQCWEQFQKFVVAFLERRLSTELRKASKRFRERYQEWILPDVKAQFLSEVHTYDQRNPVAAWLEAFIKRLVTEKIGRVTDESQLVDEELVRLANAGMKDACDELMERYAPIINKSVWGIAWNKQAFPRPVDAPAFIADVAQNVCVQVTANLGTFRFEQPFKHWVTAICSNEVENERRRIVGRAQGGPRSYVSWEELSCHPVAPAIGNRDHVEILKKIFDEYRKRGVRAQKCLDAIELTYFEGLEVPEVADRLNTTKDYIYQLFSHDYPELRRISIDNFGFSGTDL